ncbi:hypothetical protein [Microlunatus ginsengisoli]
MNATTRPAGRVPTGANLTRWRAAHARRSSNAAVPHRNRRREAARGLGRGGRAGARAAWRTGRWDR